MRNIMMMGALGFALVLSGCDDPSNSSSSLNPQGGGASGAPEVMLASDMAPRRAAVGFKAQSGPSTRMEIGRSYRIEIAQGGVDAAMQADRKACLEFGCVITSVNASKVSGKPRASLSAMVPQEKASAFHDHVMGAQNRVVTSFQETAHNRNEQYQDIKSRLERLEFMRKRLFALADQKSDKVGELLQVERELMRVETDIERLTRNRKGVEKVTDNVAFNLNYRARPLKAGDVDFTPFKGLLSDMTNTMFQAVRTTMLWIARWLPAVLFGLGALYLMMRHKSDEDDA